MPCAVVINAVGVTCVFYFDQQTGSTAPPQPHPHRVVRERHAQNWHERAYLQAQNGRCACMHALIRLQVQHSRRQTAHPGAGLHLLVDRHLLHRTGCLPHQVHSKCSSQVTTRPMSKKEKYEKRKKYCQQVALAHTASCLCLPPSWCRNEATTRVLCVRVPALGRDPFAGLLSSYTHVSGASPLYLTTSGRLLHPAP